MTITNETPFVEGIALGMGPGREPCLAVLLKATFRLPEATDGAPAEPAEEQLPLLSEDEFYKGDITGSVRLESDAVVFKPRADVVLVGTARAPGGRPVTALEVGLRVGRLRHVVRVIGDRRWTFPTRLAVVPVMSAPEPFTEMPLVYERAFGGFDHKGGAWCPENLIGRGFIGKKRPDSVDGRLLPNLEDPRAPIRSWEDRPAPVGFGFYGRSWRPRAALTGRSSELHPVFGLPADFDHGFFNGAHPALQAPGYLAGDEEVELQNVTEDGYRRFRLPGLRPHLAVRTFEAERDGPSVGHPLEAHLDTLVLLPDEGLFYQVWRGTYPLPDLSLDAIAGIEVGMASDSARQLLQAANPSRHE